MIKSLAVAFLTARREPQTNWFLDSLDRETGEDYSNIKIIIVDSFAEERIPWGAGRIIGRPRTVAPKPTIWSGKHRITRENWWSKCNSANTAICLCDTEYIAFVDDRSVLMPGWLHAIQDAMTGDYAVCGTYEKREHLVVENGELLDWGNLLGVDDRRPQPSPRRTKDWYGGSCALPLEWCLKVGGFPEDLCDGLGFEDVAFGILLRNNNLPMCFDSHMKIVEDRTPGQIDGALKRASKPSPDSNIRNAKDYRILDIMNDSFTSGNSFDIRSVRDAVLRGEPFPSPTASYKDWFDGAEISEMT